MRFLRGSSLFGLAIVFMLLLAACGTSADTSTTTSTTSTTNSTDNTSSYGNSDTNVTPTAIATSDAVIKTASATVQGKTATILTNAQGLTLYYFKPDTATTSACTGGCLTNWPPLIATGDPASATTLPGKLSTQTTPGGMQVQYNGHFLYTFASDKAAGDTKGEGVGSKWYVATADLAQL